MRRSLPFLALILTVPAALAQPGSARPLITGPISGRVLSAVRNSVPAIAQPKFDVGVAPADTVLHDVRLILAHTPRQEADLKAYIAGETNPASPDYHKWLTPQQFGDRFGLDQADVNTLVDWLKSRGFSVRPVQAGRIVIRCSGSVANIEATFNVHMDSFRRGAVSFISNVDAPQIPAALAPAIQAISGLNTLKPRPLYIRGGAGKYSPSEHRFVPELAQGGQLNVTPADAATIYNTPNTFNGNYKTSSGPAYTGKGVTIGIVGDASVDMTPIQNYRSLFLGESTLPVVENPNNINTPTNSNDSIEAYMDLELSGGLAPGANLIYYEDDTADDAAYDAISANKVDILSISYGLNEAAEPGDFENYYWQQAAAQGITVVVASGDAGAAGAEAGHADQAGFA